MSKQLGNPNFFFSPWPRDRISVHAWPLSSFAHLHSLQCLYPLAGQLSLGCISDAISLSPARMQRRALPLRGMMGPSES
jgi:hypothetical protein